MSADARRTYVVSDRFPDTVIGNIRVDHTVSKLFGKQASEIILDALELILVEVYDRVNYNKKLRPCIKEHTTYGLFYTFKDGIKKYAASAVVGEHLSYGVLNALFSSPLIIENMCIEGIIAGQAFLAQTNTIKKIEVNEHKIEEKINAGVAREEIVRFVAHVLFHEALHVAGDTHPTIASDPKKEARGNLVYEAGWCFLNPLRPDYILASPELYPLVDHVSVPQ